MHVLEEFVSWVNCFTKAMTVLSWSFRQTNGRVKSFPCTLSSKKERKRNSLQIRCNEDLLMYSSTVSFKWIIAINWDNKCILNSASQFSFCSSFVQDRVLKLIILPTSIGRRKKWRSLQIAKVPKVTTALDLLVEKKSHS